MKSMKMNKSVAKEATAPVVAEKGEGPEYPYGLCLRIDKAELIKLGFEGLPKIGDTFEIEAKCVCKGVSMSAGDKHEYASAEFQITDMELEDDQEDKNKKAAKILFTSMKD
jgi:hypothetical protein